MPKIILIYHNLNNNSYYYRTVRTTCKEYEIGQKNQYNHQIILIIPGIYLYKYKISLLKRLLTRIIIFLQQLNNKIN